MTTRYLGLAALLAPVAVGCSLLHITPAPIAPSSPVRGELRAAVDLAKDAWIFVAQACVDQQTSPGGMPAACEAVMPLAHDSILAAASAVDSLDSSSVVSPQSIVCALTSAASQLASVPVVASPVVQDALSVAQGLGQCTQAATDAGGQ